MSHFFPHPALLDQFVLHKVFHLQLRFLLGGKAAGAVAALFGRGLPEVLQQKAAQAVLGLSLIHI